MAFDLLKSAEHVRGLSNAEFRVLFYLLASANNNSFKCYPRIKTIAERTEMSERTVQRHISALADRGLFERVEQRREDGSRSSNLYRFVAVGTMKIGREPEVNIEPEPETYEEQQPAKNGGLRNPPKMAGGPRQNCRDINQEPKPVILETPLPSEGAPAVEVDLFGEPVLPDKPILSEWIAERWASLVARQSGIAPIRKIDDTMAKALEAKAKKQALDGQDSIDVWREFFELVDKSDFLRGLCQPGPGRDKPFRLNIGFVLRGNNFREIMNGKYTDDSTRSSGGGLGPTGKALSRSIERLRDAGERRRSGSGPQGGYSSRA